MQQRIAEGVASSHSATIARTVVGISHVALMLKLVYPRRLLFLTTCVGEETKVDATVFLGREVGIEDIGGAYAYHKRVGLQLQTMDETANIVILASGIIINIYGVGRRTCAPICGSLHSTAATDEGAHKDYVLKDLHSR